jgi:competence protein ComEC
VPPALRATCLVTVGIVLGWAGLPMPALAAAASVAALCLSRRQWRRYGPAALLVCAAWLRWLVVTDVAPLPIDADADVPFQGVVLERVQRATTTELRMRGRIQRAGDDAPRHTTVLARCRGNIAPTVGYGTVARVSGSFDVPPGQRNPGGFDYARYLRRRGVHGIVQVQAGDFTATGVGGWWALRQLGRARARVLRTLDAGLPSPYDALAAGILLGERRAIPDDILDMFRDGGVIHVLVVSGANFALLVAALYVLLAACRMPLRVVYIGTMLLAVAFAALIGPQPPVLRALLVCLFYLAARLLERGSNPMNALAVSAVILLLWNPYALFDAGFQLSYAATAGLLYFTPRWLAPLAAARERFRASWLGRLAWNWIVVAGLATLAAQVATLPITLYHFQRVSLAGVGANLPVGIIVAASMVCAMVVAIVGFVSLAASAVLANALWLLLAILNPIVAFFAGLPYAVLFVPRDSAPHLAVWLFAALTVAHLRDVAARAPQWGIVALAVVSCSVWGETLTRPDGLVRLTFLDVGQGDAAVVQSPDGVTMVVDGGARSRRYDYGESAVTPYLLSAGDTRIESVVMTHPDNDHSGGLPYVIRTLGAEQVFGVDGGVLTGAMAEMSAASAERGTTPTLGAGGTIHRSRAGDIPLSVEVIYPRAPGDIDLLDGDANADSLVLMVRYGAFRALLTGDIEADVEGFLAQGAAEGWIDIGAHVLKVPHHGSRSSSSARFVDAVSPSHAVVSVGARNRYGHPSQDVLARYEDADATVLRTDFDGAITLATDGTRVWVRRWAGERR